MDNTTENPPKLKRQLGLIGLIATGVCSMMGASINVVPFMIQRNVEGIGPYVLPAFLIAAIPALLAAIGYSTLSAAMPRAGGSYIYTSRGLHPYLGFISSFSQWFGLSIVIGVIAYIIVPFGRDVAIAMQWADLAEWLEKGSVRVSIALLLIWIFVYINILGTRIYQRTLIPMMIIMFLLGSIVIFAGYSFTHEDFLGTLSPEALYDLRLDQPTPFDWTVFLSASALLFSSFIGFDSIAQAGGEAKNPTRTLPLAILCAIGIVGIFYFIFTAAVYHAVPWSYIAAEAQNKDISAPGLLNALLPQELSVAILVGATIALINDLPAMLLSVSRLMFAWAKDGVFPKGISKIHHKFATPHIALIVSGVIASIGVIGSHFAGDFFLGIDIMVTSMMVNFLFICLTLVFIRNVNPKVISHTYLESNIRKVRIIGMAGVISLLFFLCIHTYKDLNNSVEAWYFHSTWVWLIVMSMGSMIYFLYKNRLVNMGIDFKDRIQQLPTE